MTGAAVVTAWRYQWAQTVIVVFLLVAYLLFVRLARCGVETRKHRPCRWLVRGLCGTCDWHVGDKRGLPTLVPGDGPMSLPKCMWPRSGLEHPLTRPCPRQESEPGSAGTVAPKARHLSPYQRLTLVVSIAGVVICLASFLLSLLSKLATIMR